MRKNFGAKPWTYPQPVFILASWNEAGTADAMNAAWGGVSDDKELSFCISAGHKSAYGHDAAEPRPCAALGNSPQKPRSSMLS